MRMGRKAQPFYRIVAIDSRNQRDGAFIEKIGHYNPLHRPAEVEIDDAKALKWLSRGAIPSDTVKNLFSRRGVMMAFALQKKGFAEEEIWNQVSQFRLDKDAKLKAKEEAAVAAHEKKIAPPPAKAKEKAAEPETTKAAPAEATVEEPATEKTEVEEKAEAAVEESVKEQPADDEKQEVAAEEKDEKPAVEETVTEEKAEAAAGEPVEEAPAEEDAKDASSDDDEAKKAE